MKGMQRPRWRCTKKIGTKANTESIIRDFDASDDAVEASSSGKIGADDLLTERKREKEVDEYTVLSL